MKQNELKEFIVNRLNIKDRTIKEGHWDLLKQSDVKDAITILKGPQKRMPWKMNCMKFSIKLEEHKALKRCGESTSATKRVNETRLQRLTQSMTW